MNEAITVDSPPAGRAGEIRLDRNELAGAFGDIGTDLPLIVGMILAAKLDSASVLVLFGAMQVLTALRYRMPMPVQPLKAVAALVITQKLSGSLLYGGGLAIGLLMLALPQISLSLGNSVLATQQIARDLFPERRIGVRSIGFTYSLMNLINPFFGGIPTCHGSGGMMGHYAFGARTGGSVILYGLLYLIL